MVRPPVLAQLLGVTAALLLSQCRPCGAALDCIGFEAYSQCGEPEEAFRHEQGDVPCEEATELAGYCVCESEGCTDEANAIRVEIDCVGKGAQLAELDSARNCSTVCSKHSSNMWIAGIAASVGASCSTAVGLIVQKSAQLKNQALPADKRPPEFFGFIMAPLWIMGFLLLVLVPLPFNLMAVTWAAASLIAPLAAVTLVINQVLAPFTLDESLSRVDVVATVIIVAGVVLATAFGTHCESSYTPDDLIELYAEPPFLICAATLLVCLVTSYVTIRRWRRTLPAKLDTEAMAALGGQAPERVCVAYAFLAGSTGALMQIVFKGIGELVGAAAFDHWALWVFIPLMVILATCQMSFLNKGMEVCNAVKFFPTYNASLIVMMTLTGMLYYEEYKVLGGPTAWVCFTGGVLLVILGVLLLTKRSTEAEHQVVPLGGSEDDSPASGRVTPVSGLIETSSRRSSFQVPLGKKGQPLALGMSLVDPRPPSQPSSPSLTPSNSAAHSGGGGSPPTAALVPAEVVPAHSVSSAVLSPARQELRPAGQASRASGTMPTIQGGDTPLASLSAEDALAFREIQRMRPDLMARAGAMTAEQLMEEVSRKLETIDGADRTPSPLSADLRSAWTSETGNELEPQPQP